MPPPQIEPRNGRASLARQGLDRSPSKSDVQARIFPRRINEERARRIHVVVMTPSACSIVDKWKQSAFGRVAIVATHQEIVPVVCEPIVPRVLLALAALLAHRSLRSEVFHRPRISGLEYCFAIAAFLVLGLQQLLLHGNTTINSLLDWECLRAGPIIFRTPIKGFAVLSRLRLALLPEDFRGIRWSFYPNHD